MDRVFRIVTFQEADELDIEYWRNATFEEKLDMVQRLREIYYQMYDESRKGLQRVYRIVERP